MVRYRTVGPAAENKMYLALIFSRGQMRIISDCVYLTRQVIGGFFLPVVRCMEAAKALHAPI